MMSLFTLCPVLWAFLSLDVGLGPSTAGAEPVSCRRTSFRAGEIITTVPDDRKSFCGSRVGYFYALQDNVLFHLQCQSNDANPSEATAVILDVNSVTTRSQVFDDQSGCEVRYPPNGVPPTKAYEIAQKLALSSVPFDRNGCNAHHYVQYLASGTARTPGAKAPLAFCPVYAPFNASTNINAFKLAGNGNLFFGWPTTSFRKLVAQTSGRTPTTPFAPYSSKAQVAPRKSTKRAGVKFGEPGLPAYPGTGGIPPGSGEVPAGSTGTFNPRGRGYGGNNQFGSDTNTGEHPNPNHEVPKVYPSDNSYQRHHASSATKNKPLLSFSWKN